MSKKYIKSRLRHKAKMHSGLSKGFASVEKSINPKRFKYLADCSNCMYNVGKSLVECENTKVTQFDIIKDEETQREFCGYWKL